MAYSTTCPDCKESNCLTVISACVYFSAPLSHDGFSILDARDLDTDAEQVECNQCGTTFSLESLYTDYEPAALQGCSHWYLNPQDVYFGIKAPHELSLDFLNQDGNGQIFDNYDAFIAAVMTAQNLTREEVEPYIYLIDGDRVITDRGSWEFLIDWDEEDHPETLEDALIDYCV